MRNSLHAPQQTLPFSRKPVPPNIFFSVNFLRQARSLRSRSARTSSLSTADLGLPKRYGFARPVVKKLKGLVGKILPGHEVALTTGPQRIAVEGIVSVPD